MLKLYLAVRWRDVFIALGIALVIGAGVVVYRSTYANTDFEIVDALGGNIFPSAILSVATTDVELIQPVDTPSSCPTAGGITSSTPTLRGTTKPCAPTGRPSPSVSSFRRA